jgi:heat shock protein beta
MWKATDIKLLVKRVFITSEFGDDSLPKWASWLKVIVDGTGHCLSSLTHAQ